jgi:formiminoglutamate deiminase
VSASYLLERAWVAGALRTAVLVEVDAGRFTRVEPDSRDAELPRDTELVSGLTLPGFANTHSHAFHRALRGRTQRGRGTFWTWRDQMYDVAGRLDPDSYYALARATYREMAAAGITTVGEFHYLHHQPDGTPYDEPNAMGDALTAAAQEAGVRICLLDTCYLSAGFGRPVEGVQRRFSDGTVDAWVERMSGQREPADGVMIGGAFHSVRAVPREDIRRYTGAILHVHLSEQVAENEQCLATYGVTPARLLHESGNHLGPQVTVVHATHLTDDDIELLGTTGTNVCITPTTERDLADGIGPAERLQRAGCRITLGSDSHAVIDPFEEMRGLEMDERLASQERGHWSAAELLVAATGHATIGFPDAGRIAVGDRADLVSLDTTTPRTAGTGADEHTAAFAATAADVVQVISDGRLVFTRGDEVEIGRELDRAVGALWP